MKTPLKAAQWSRACLPVVSLIGFSGAMFAQSAAPVQPVQNTAEETVTLSPFEVKTDRDVGYTAAETVAGGRINTDLKNTPAAISVLNRQFLNDIATTNIADATEWTVNAAPGYDSGLTDNGVNFRGPNGSFFSRNYFLWYVPSDEFNLERLEFARGPNGVLFGDGNLGGIATVTTKRAYLGRRKNSVTMRADSYGGYRATADLSIPAGERFALRLNLLDHQGASWRDHADTTRYGAHLAGTVKLDQKSNFRFEGEWGRRNRQRYVANYLDNASYWDKTTTYSGGAALVTTGKGVTRVDTTANHFVYIPENSAAGFSNWATFYRTTGPNIAIQPDLRTDIPVAGPALPSRKMNLNSTDNLYELIYYTYSGFIDRRFSDDFYVELGASHTMSDYDSRVAENSFNQYYIDINTIMPNGQANPFFGKVYSEVQRNTTSVKNTLTEVRALANYRFENSWLNENISAIVGTRADLFDFYQARLVRTNGLPRLTDSSNQYYERRYWDSPAREMPIPQIDGYTFGFYPTGASKQRKFLDYAQLATVSKLFGDRVTVFLGGRYDKVDQTQRSLLTNASVVDPVTGVGVLGANLVPASGGAAVPVVGGKAITEKSVVSKNAGAVYFPLKWLGVFANYSQSFAVPDSGNNLIDGTVPGISRNEGYDAGVRLSLGSGKLYADLRYYESKQRDQLTNTGAATQINAIWNRLGRSDLATVAYRDTQDLDLEGYEFEVTANPTRNLRLIANYALPRKVENVNALPGLRAYYAAHRAEWEAAAVTDATIASNLTTINALLVSNSSFATTNGTWKYRANVFANYTFTDTKLKGLSAGLGANFVGPVKIGSVPTAFDYRYSNAYYLVTAKLGYDMRIANYPVTLQLNVTNLLDNDDIVFTNYTTFREGGVSTNPAYYVPNGFRYLDPRQFIFTATVRF